MWIYVSSLTRQITPSFNACRPLIITLHLKYEMFGLYVAPKGFPDSIWPGELHDDFGICSNHHPCHASIAKLKRCRSLNPIPHRFFWLHIVSHGKANSCYFHHLVMIKSTGIPSWLIHHTKIWSNQVTKSLTLAPLEQLLLSRLCFMLSIIIYPSNLSLYSFPKLVSEIGKGVWLW
jgi:hypothetical protein